MGPKPNHPEAHPEVARNQGSNLKLQPLEFVPAVTGSIKEADALTIQTENGRYRQLSPLQGTPHLPANHEPASHHNPLDFDPAAKSKNLEPLRHSHPSKGTSFPNRDVNSSVSGLTEHQHLHNQHQHNQHQQQHHHRNNTIRELSPIHSADHKHRSDEINNKTGLERKGNRVLSPLSIPLIASHESTSQHQIHGQHPIRHNTLSPIEHEHHQNHNHHNQNLDVNSNQPATETKDTTHLPPLKPVHTSNHHNTEEAPIERCNHSPIPKLPPVTSAAQSSPERAHHPKKRKPGSERREVL